MKIENAIKKLESCSIVPFMGDDCEAAGIAIAALKEKQERDKGCERCCTVRAEPNAQTPEEALKSIYGAGFCYKCGRKLGENNANRRPESENKPLTLEELRERDGKPVWIVAHPDWGHWELSEDAEDYFEDRDEDFYGMSVPPTIPDPMGRYGLHMLGWLAYDHEPKGE